MATSSSHVDFEDTVEYWLYPNLAKDVDELEQLQAFRTRCFTFIHERSQTFIWHEESINLRVIPHRTAAGHSGKYPEIVYTL